MQKLKGFLNKKNLLTTVCTTVSEKNYSELDSIYNLLHENNIDTWQLQLAVPMGSMHANLGNKTLAPGKINNLLEFIDRKQNNNKKFPRTIVTDCIGYRSKLSVKVRAFYNEKNTWGGCQAGKRVIGILHNGDIIGCTSFRNMQYVEGNIREKSLKEIWTSKNTFSWNRKFDSNTLTGYCKKCQYKDNCKGGCSSLKYFTNKTLTENPYCAYKQDMEVFKRVVKQIKDLQIIEKLITNSLECKSYNTAEEALKAFLSKAPTSLRKKHQLGFVYYQLGQYEECYNISKELLNNNPKDSYALQGTGLALAKLNKVEEGIKLLRKSIKYASNKDQLKDCYNDLAKVLNENGQSRKALNVCNKIKHQSL